MKFQKDKREKRLGKLLYKQGIFIKKHATRDIPEIVIS